MKKAITDATERSPQMDKRKKAGIIISVIQYALLAECNEHTKMENV